jgi:hypothetical protein
MRRRGSRHSCHKIQHRQSSTTVTMSASVPPPSEASSITNSTSNSVASTNDISTTGANPRILRIAVGSTNPSTIAAVQQAFGKAVYDVQSSSDNDNDESSNNDRIKLDIQGFSVASGVPDQPYGDQETNQGAKRQPFERTRSRVPI